MIQSINQKCNVLAHITINIVRAAKKLRGLVNQVCSKNSGKDTVLICLVKLFKSVGKQAKGGKDEDLPGSAVFKLSGDFKHAVPGGDHIIYDNHILSFDSFSQKFMGNYAPIGRSKSERNNYCCCNT